MYADRDAHYPRVFKIGGFVVPGILRFTISIFYLRRSYDLTVQI